MIEQSEAHNGSDPLLKPFIDFWSRYFEQADATTRQMFEGIHGLADQRVWQRQWLKAVSASADAYLRSPPFLAAMKRNMDGAITAKRQSDDLQKEFARNANIPTADDISGLFERLRGIEELILTRLSHIEERLTAIENKLQNEQE